MRRYCIKCRQGKIEYFDILKETDDGYMIRLTRISDGNEKIIEEFMSKPLFRICVKTGYVYEIEKTADSVA
jgi:hypothetical protein